MYFKFLKNVKKIVDGYAALYFYKFKIFIMNVLFLGIRFINVLHVFAYITLFLGIFFGSRDTSDFFYRWSPMHSLLEKVIGKTPIKTAIKSPTCIRVFSLIMIFF